MDFHLLPQDFAVHVSWRSFNGRLAKAILRAAKTRGVDLIVIGANSLGTLSGILLGSQSLKVLHHADCPVLVV